MRKLLVLSIGFLFASLDIAVAQDKYRVNR
jgi:hypothetical protein